MSCAIITQLVRQLFMLHFVLVHTSASMPQQKHFPVYHIHKMKIVFTKEKLT